jgi:hypothetical protein
MLFARVCLWEEQFFLLVGFWNKRFKNGGSFEEG